MGGWRVSGEGGTDAERVWELLGRLFKEQILAKLRGTV
jgi:hypothetical protein